MSLSVAAGLASLGAGLLLLPFILQATSAASYGVWLILSSVSAYLYFSDVGVGSAISHFGSRARGGHPGPNLSGLLASGLVWSAITCAVVSPLFVLFALWFVDSSSGSMTADERSFLVLLSMGLLLPLLLRPFGSALIGAGYLTVDRRNQLLGVCVRVLGTISACLLDAGIVGIAVAELMALLVPSVLAIFSLYRRRVIDVEKFRVSTKTLRVMLSFSYRSFGVNVVGAMTLQSGMLVVGAAGTPADVTYYNAAFRVFSSVRQLLTWTIDPFRPALSRLFAKDKRDGESVLMAVLLVSFGAGAVGSIALIISAPDLLELWLGDSVPVGDVALASQILLVGLLINMIHIPLAPATDAVGKPGALFLGQLTWFIICLCLSFPLATTYGISGVALALSLPLLVVEPLMLFLGTRALPMTFATWVRLVAFPVACIVGTSGAITFGTYVAAVDMLGKYPWLVLGGIFGVCSVMSTVLFSRVFGLKRVIRALNIDL